MVFQFKVLNITRQNILSKIENLLIDQINFIPNNYNNSIGWQVGHLLVTQQILHYKLSNLPLNINKDLVEHFSKGSSGKFIIESELWNEIITLFKRLPLQLENDYNGDIFTKYNEYTTSYNITLKNIEEAITFNNCHEAMHFGTISSMLKHIPELG